MVQYPDDYLFRRQLIAALRPSLQKEVLHRGITAEFSSMQDILEKVKDIKDSSHYDIGSQMSVETAHSSAYVLDTDHQWISDKSIPLHHPPPYLPSPKSVPISITSPTLLCSSLFPLFHPSSLCSLFH